MSAVAQGVAALVSALTAASPTAFQVLDGGVLQTEDEFVIVGFVDSDAAPDINLTISLTDHIQRVARFDVDNLLSVFIGDTDVAAARARVLTLFDGYRAAFAADPTLGRAVVEARIVSAGLNQSITGQGAVATVAFTVSVIASTAV